MRELRDAEDRQRWPIVGRSPAVAGRRPRTRPRAQLADWRGLLTRNVESGREVLKALLEGRSGSRPWSTNAGARTGSPGQSRWRNCCQE